MTPLEQARYDLAVSSLRAVAWAYPPILHNHTATLRHHILPLLERTNTMPPPRVPGYTPTEANDHHFLVAWAERFRSTPEALSLAGQRYLAAMKRMSTAELGVFLSTLVVASGQSLPPFPDQQ